MITHFEWVPWVPTLRNESLALVNIAVEHWPSFVGNRWHNYQYKLMAEIKGDFGVRYRVAVIRADNPLSDEEREHLISLAQYAPQLQKEN